jgi:mannan endo-1,6-alpha-mannosidase
MATTTQLASYTAGTVFPLLATSASAAARFCNQGTNNTQCTMWWTTNDGPLTIGVGQQMSALNVFNANMMKFVSSSSVASANTGGTSSGNPNAGSPNSDQLTTYFLSLPFPVFRRLIIKD